MNKPFNQSQIKERIIKWEENFPVDEWQIEGVDIWPYLRIKLYLFLLNYGDKKSLVGKKLKERANNSVSNKGFLDMTFSILRAIINQFFFFRNLKTKRIIFFGAHFHRNLENGLYFNRFFDPMIARHNLHKKVYFFEYTRVFENIYNPEGIIELRRHLNDYKLISKIKSKFKYKIKSDQSNLKVYNTFYRDLIEEFPEVLSLKIDESDLYRWAGKITNTKKFFLKVYRKVKPEKLLFLSYYGYDDLAAAILASHELNIKSIDFQHGPQTNVHMAYSSWTKHPHKPYNTMPIEYWNWDLESKKNINSWAEMTGIIKSKMVGHPYIAYFSSFDKYREIEKYIFFSLQTLTLEEMLPKRLLEVIGLTNYKWIFRMHPRSDYSAEDIIGYFDSQGVKKEDYMIEDAKQIPLPRTLSKTHLHITNFSGCVLEAMMLGIPSIIVHEAGREMFRNYLDDKKVYYINRYKKDFQIKLKYLLESETEELEKCQNKDVVNPLLVD